MFRCPLCFKIIEKDPIIHVVDEHEDWWSARYDLHSIPRSVSKFNERFATIGIKIIEIPNIV